MQKVIVEKLLKSNSGSDYVFSKLYIGNAIVFLRDHKKNENLTFNNTSQN